MNFEEDTLSTESGGRINCVNIAPTTYELSARGRIFDGLFERANDHFDRDEFDESERLCHLLLDYPDLGDYHKAGCHRILSLGEDNFLWHAQQAVELYENLFTVRPGGSYSGKVPPTQAELDAQQTLLNLAKKCLAQASKDHNDLQVDYKFQHHALWQKHWRKPTREELIVAHHLRHNKQQVDFVVTFEDRYVECLQPSMEDGDDEDGDDEDEGSQNAVNDEDDDKLDSDGSDPLPELNYDFDLPTPEASSQPEPSSSQPRPAAVTSRKGKAS
ncbi:hypothetical protein D6C97_02640 [Aureobasidium pullulans]|nr:hypothetical protein D6C97_02640 [Aureobasidium pullulans]